MRKSVEALKNSVCAAIDGRTEEIITLARDIWANPELGYKEHRTASLVANLFGSIKVPYIEGVALTGVKGRLIGGKNAGPVVAVMGELDAVINSDHPDAHPVTGAVHACGHNCQIASMLGVAFGLTDSGVMPYLDGEVVLFAVPAEETIEVEWRMGLKRQGQIEFLSGKPELLARGEFDDIDIAMMVHGMSNPEYRQCRMVESINGYFVKRIEFLGRSAHAGSVPHQGVNALNGAVLAMAGINAQRETFRDPDTVRIHPIITKGGSTVNVVPSDVRMESFVRGKSIEAIVDANRKVDRALRAGAMAVGAKVQIETLAGHLPQVYYRDLAMVFRNNMVGLIGANEYMEGGHTTGSTDIGDLSQVKPTIQPHAGGATGTGHGADYQVVDYTIAVVNPAKAMAMTVIDLLAHGGAYGRQIIASQKPPMSKEQYLEFMRQWTCRDEFDEGNL
jgi:amidohydrolase